MLKMTRARFGLALAMPFLLTAALLFLTIHSARSQEADPSFVCGAETAFNQTLEKVQAVPGMRVFRMGAEETTAFLGVLNKMEPPTEWAGDSMVFIVTPDKAVMFVILKAGVACISRTPIPEAAFQAMMKAAFGAPA